MLFLLLFLLTCVIGMGIAVAGVMCVGVVGTVTGIGAY